MTLYLTNDTAADEIDRAKTFRIHPRRQALPRRRDDAFGGRRHRHQAASTAYSRAWRKSACALLVHGESPQADVDVFDRETHFIDTVLAPLLERFPALPVVFEHITTARAVEFVAGATRRRRRHHHAAASAAQSQRDFSRRHHGRTIIACRS